VEYRQEKLITLEPGITYVLSLRGAGAPWQSI
jgi:hypothetical protein